MKTQFERTSGMALIVGSGLLIVTMVLHPAGGSIQHILSTVRVIIISHSIALLAIPFIAVGFWGLTTKLGTGNFSSMLAFSFLVFALIAGMIAAAINGLALPIFIRNYSEAVPDSLASIKPILKSNLSLNQAFDFIYIVAMCLAILFWSVAIVRTKRVSVWIGYAGIVLSAIVILLLTSGFVFTNLQGFRVFILGIMMWTVLIGRFLLRSHAYATNISINQ